MEDLKNVIAGNIGQLRRNAGMTQLDMAERLNYSDKAISKWERGESLPDIVTLKEIADLFRVSVDYLLRPDHPIEEDVRREYTRRQKRNHRLITAMSAMLVWFIATFVFTNIDMISADVEKHWLCFVYAVPVTAIVVLVFNSIWGKRRYNFLIVSVLLWAIIVSVFLSALPLILWQLFIIGVPAQIVVFLWSGLRIK